MNDPRLTLLVVEDDPDLRAYIRRTLERLCPFVGVIHEAETGGAALELLRGGGIGGLVTDVQLPGMDGIDLCRTIERELGPGRVPVLLVSGESSRTGDAHAFAGEAGHRAFLPKPFNATQLAGAVTALFGGG
jgi:CheY-like chemotaxis protein